MGDEFVLSAESSQLMQLKKHAVDGRQDGDKRI